MVVTTHVASNLPLTIMAHPVVVITVKHAADPVIQVAILTMTL